VSQTLHLTRRFFGSLWPFPPGAADEAWARHHLVPGEVALWSRMSRADRRHAVGVARRVEAALGHDAARPVIAAALLHDVGKATAGLGTYGRVVATLAAAVAGRETAEAWSTRRGFTRRTGLYLRHPELGGDLLAMAGSDRLTDTWAREHHLPPDRWSLDPRLASALKEADDD
jgi:hypothetical protein